MMVNTHCNTHKSERTHNLGAQPSQVRQRVLVVACVLDLNPQVVLVALVLLRKIRRVLEVARLAAHTDRGIEVERELVLVAGGGRAERLALDEAVKARNVLELRVRVQQERRVVRVREPERVQLLQVRHEVMYPLCVQELRGCQSSC